MFKYSSWMDMSHTLSGIIWKDEWIFKVKGVSCLKLADIGMQIALPFTFCNIKIVVNVSQLISVWALSHLQNEILKINPLLKGHEANWFCIGGLSRARELASFLWGFFIVISVAELEAKEIKTEVVNSIDCYKALQMLFLEQRWSQTLCYPTFLFLPLYTQPIRNLQAETHLFIYFTIVINALLQWPSFCVLRVYNRHSTGYSVSRLCFCFLNTLCQV